MDVRRLLAALGATTVSATVAAMVPSAAFAAPAAPGTISAKRMADVHQIQVTWKAVPGADHYNVDVVKDDGETVAVVPAGTTSFVVDAPDGCATFKIRVGAADATDASSYTGYYTVK